ncbi:hypothetical protein HELRODRAFT_159522 [Helobdella robusta]|uniref:Uncharacterized protein n=1 Tax=Helobdella robusta TaxID=6412 RepID=T1EP45_HELRO|nr:hypothetical protein HELRODRAFT_159522 [Helobdella robusta]ESO12933.1 hypothetical protein HELRODRAFT_159522 [Helobdella robusta]
MNMDEQYGVTITVGMILSRGTIRSVVRRLLLTLIHLLISIALDAFIQLFFEIITFEKYDRVHQFEWDVFIVRAIFSVFIFFYVLTPKCSMKEIVLHSYMLTLLLYFIFPVYWSKFIGWIHGMITYFLNAAVFIIKFGLYHHSEVTVY